MLWWLAALIPAFFILLTLHRQRRNKLAKLIAETHWDTMLSFEGNTAPYLQYAYTRVKSILRKAGIDADTAQHEVKLEQHSELSLATKLVQYEDALLTVSRDATPHVLCAYLYELASAFMTFYEACPILKDGIAEDVRSSRLTLAVVTSRTLQHGLDLLGIETMEHM